MKKLTLIYFTMAALLGMVAISASAAEHSPSLDEVMALAKPDEPVAVVIFLDYRLEMKDIYPVAKELPMTERREYVITQLKDRFAETSPRVMNYLVTEKKLGHVSLLRPLWIMNAIRVSANKDVITAISKQFGEIYYIAHDPVFENTLDDISGWGVIDIGANNVWYNLGVFGEGVIVGHKDSGCDYWCSGFDGHIWINPGEDLNGNGSIDSPDSNNVDDDGNGYIDDFRGWSFDYDVNDVRDRQTSQSPFYHGTRTSSVVSSGANPCDTVSVAPGAKLMILEAYLTQGAVWEASQYAVEKGANVITASLSFPLGNCNNTNLFDCPNYVAHRWISEMELAAGLIHSNSTGNSGQGGVPYSIPAPANCPPPAMTPTHEVQGGVSSMVAVQSYTQGNNLGSGGAGPTLWSSEDLCINPRMPFCGQGEWPEEFEDYPMDEGGLFKPDVAAPTNAMSISGGCGCESIGGTSGATPHVGGALALIYSAFPGITPEDAYLFLVNNVADAGLPGPDSLWGFGKVRVYDAIVDGQDTVGEVHGVVTLTPGGTPLEGVRVSTESSQTIYTDENGNYLIWLEPGQQSIEFWKYGYTSSNVVVNVTAGGSVAQNSQLPVAPASNLSITVRGNQNAPLANAHVRILETGLEGVTNGSGVYQVTNFFAGIYQVVALEDFSDFYDMQALEVIVPSGTFGTTITTDYNEAYAATGPDAFGHFAYENGSLHGPNYDWVEINPAQGGPGENLNLSGDNCVFRNLPFTFRYYGQNFTAIGISMNGYIVAGSCGGASGIWARAPIPCTLEPNNLLSVYFQDYVTQAGTAVCFYNDVANGRVIVEWWNVLEYFETGSATFQAILYPPVDGEDSLDSQIKFQYFMTEPDIETAVGIENSFGTDGVEYSHQLMYPPTAAPIHAGRAIMFEPQSLTSNDPTGGSLPQEYALDQNYPNPFNATTTFTFSVPRAGEIKLALYDILGRETVVVFQGNVSAGTKSVSFDGDALSSGIYFARLESGSVSHAIRKVVLLK